MARTDASTAGLQQLAQWFSQAELNFPNTSYLALDHKQRKRVIDHFLAPSGIRQLPRLGGFDLGFNYFRGSRLRIGQ